MSFSTLTSTCHDDGGINICLREAQAGQRLLSEVQREDSAVQAEGGYGWGVTKLVSPY